MFLKMKYQITVTCKTGSSLDMKNQNGYRRRPITEDISSFQKLFRKLDINPHGPLCINWYQKAIFLNILEKI